MFNISLTLITRHDIDVLRRKKNVRIERRLVKVAAKMTKEAKTHQPSAGGTTGPTAVGTRTDTRDDVVETVRRTLEDMLLEMKACQVPTGLKKLKKEKKQHNKTNKGKSQ